ncbi:MAG: hypothetical protein M3Q31_24000 [Actinomycetota bacterium]|nr:hypothetical protein [Actinomycetota bacterium]
MSPAISQTKVAGVQTGLSAGVYKARLGSSSSRILAGPDYPTRVFGKARVAVYFPGEGSRAIIITTWDKRYKTSKGIGPCSTIAQMKKAYGGAVKGSWAGTQGDVVHSYVVGNNLLFATQDHRTISAVALYRGTPGHTRGGSPQAFANYVAVSETSCVSG